MSERSDVSKEKSANQSPSVPKPAHQPRLDGDEKKLAQQRAVSNANDYDEIPVEELVRLTRELTERITNADRQRLAEELKNSDHHKSIQTNAPITLQQFFTGEIDLDTELAQRFSAAPILSSMSTNPKNIGILTRRASAILTAQDEQAMLSFDLRLQSGYLEVIFTAHNMLSFRFDLGEIQVSDRQRWLELMRRKTGGIAFLWTRKRWESDYMIFVVREYFTRVYAFSPKRFEAGVRITPDVVQSLLDWLEKYWVEAKPSQKSEVSQGPTKPMTSVEPSLESTLHDEEEPSDPQAFEW
ncbi:MAG: hypothetical protein CUN55_09745 [Phototrophicales bacterium]|nr:MAG: hypothetical protein CUN55_09745 [Phototrophicales bacterium]